MPSVRRSVRALIATGAVVLAAATPARADMCNLTTAGSGCGPGTSQSSFNAMGAIFDQITRQPTSPDGTTITGFQPTGTGYVDSFLRIQANGSEQGYNTNARPFQFDQKDPINYTHAIKINEVPTVKIGSTTYREFFLDINEPAGGTSSLLSLDQLQIFLGPVNNFDNYSNGKLDGVSPIFNLDAGGTDRWIKLDYSLNGGGSGKGDMVAFIPDSLFTNTGTNPYVYLYSQFGVQSCCTSGDGFEEWWTKSPIAPPPQTPVPEPASLALLGTGLLVAVRQLKKSRGAAK